MFRKIKMIVLILLALYVIAGLVLYAFQDKLIFLGEPLPAEYAYEFDMPFEEHNIKMKDGATINALSFSAEDSNGLIIYYHGNAGNLARWGYVAEDFVKLGYDLAIVDYRGYGKSTGTRTASNILSDAVEVYDYFSKNTPENSMIIYGRSIGTGMASHVASLRDPQKLILETPYNDLRSLAQSYMPFFPARLALKYNLNNEKNLKKVKCPVYIFHGTDDEVVPYQQGQKLFGGADKNQTTFITIEGGGHNNLSDFEAYHSNLKLVLVEDSVASQMN